MFDYVQLFQEKAGDNQGTLMPNRPALLLYLGDIAVRSRRQMLPKLLSQIPRRYHSALVEGALCSDAEAGDLAHLSVSAGSKAEQFGTFAKEWLEVSEHSTQLKNYLRERIHETTVDAVAVAMAQLDLYLVVGNDGGACELMPSIMNAINELTHGGAAIKWHLVWLCREMYPQDRDAAMCGLLHAIEEKNKETPEVQALPNGEILLETELSVTLVSDRNSKNLCSESVWDDNCCGIAAYVLVNMFGRRALSPWNSCGMYDAIYPDLFWSTGFQLSLLLKLNESLVVQKANATTTFMPKLAAAWGCTSATGLDQDLLLRKLEQALPVDRDLLIMPVNAGITPQQLKNVYDIDSCIQLLYGERFQQFFTDALEGPSLRKLVEELSDSFQQVLEQHCAENGVFAAVELMKTKSDLRQNLDALCDKTNYTARPGSGVDSVGWFADALEQRREEVFNYCSKEKMKELRGKAVRCLVDAICSKMEQLRPAYELQAKALERAISTVKQKLEDTLVQIQKPYTDTIKSLAESMRLYVTTVDEGEMAILNRCFDAGQPDVSLMKALTEMNLCENELITTSLKDTFVALQYLNGENELKNMLDDMCSAAIYTPAILTHEDIYILPQNGEWSNGNNVYGFIRIYTGSNASLLTSSPYFSSFLKKDKRTELQSGDFPLPPLQREAETVAAVNEAAPAVELQAEEKKVLGSVKYVYPNTLIQFKWPDRNVNLIDLSISGALDCGKRTYSDKITVSAGIYVRHGGVLLPNVRLTGNCDIALSWASGGEQKAAQGILTGEPIHVSRNVSVKGKEYVFTLNTTDRITDLHTYLLMRVRKAGGVVVDYRLPPLVNDEFRIPQKWCSMMPEVVLAHDELSEFISF